VPKSARFSHGAGAASVGLAIVNGSTSNYRARTVTTDDEQDVGARFGSARRAAVARVRTRLALVALRVAPTEAQRMLALTIVIGLVCGLAAVAFHEAIRLGESASLSLLQRGSSRWWLLWMLILPTAGGLVAGVLLTRFFPDARGSGIPQVKAHYAGKRGRIRLRDVIAKFFLAALQIGSGASLGREGPTVQICA
jgi:chloride channel protein, CIC family